MTGNLTWDADRSFLINSQTGQSFASDKQSDIENYCSKDKFMHAELARLQENKGRKLLNPHEDEVIQESEVISSLERKFWTEIIGSCSYKLRLDIIFLLQLYVHELTIL